MFRQPEGFQHSNQMKHVIFPDLNNSPTSSNMNTAQTKMKSSSASYANNQDLDQYDQFLAVKNNCRKKADLSSRTILRPTDNLLSKDNYNPFVEREFHRRSQDSTIARHSMSPQPDRKYNQGRLNSNEVQSGRSVSPTFKSFLFDNNEGKSHLDKMMPYKKRVPVDGFRFSENLLQRPTKKFNEFNSNLLTAKHVIGNAHIDRQDSRGIKGVDPIHSYGK